MNFLSFLIFVQYITYFVTGHKTALGIKVNYDFKKPPIATNVTNFIDLILNGNLFVDKSLLIKEILEDKKKTMLITCPHYWGKTINLNMLKTFLETPVDEEGYLLLSNTSSPNYLLFINGSIISKSGQLEKLQNPLLISQHKHIVDKYLGRCAVIYVDFSNVDGENFIEIMDSLLGRLSGAIEQHNYLVSIFNETVNSPNVAVIHKVLTQKRWSWYNDMINKSQSLNLVNIRDSLKFLARILHDYFSQPVFILIDDYDAPTTSIITNPDFPNEDRKKFFHFYFEFLATSFKQNEFIKQGVLTGVFPVTKEQRDSGLMGITEYTFFSGELMEFYGINEYEIHSIFDSIKFPQEKRNSSLSFYSRYEVLNSTLQVYRPWSIAHHLANTQQCWFEETKIQNFFNIFLQAKQFPQIFYSICAVQKGENIINKAQSFPFTWQDLNDFYNLTRTRTYYVNYENPLLRKLSLTLVDKGFMFLYTLGYLSLDNRGTNDTVIAFRIPNVEVMELMHQILKEWQDKLKTKFGN